MSSTKIDPVACLIVHFGQGVSYISFHEEQFGLRDPIYERISQDGQLSMRGAMLKYLYATRLSSSKDCAQDILSPKALGGNLGSGKRHEIT